MAIAGENSKPLDLESAATEQSQDEIRSAAQTDKVVHGVNGSLTPKARKLRPLAGIILIALIVLAAAYMRHGLASRNNKLARGQPLRLRRGCCRTRHGTDWTLARPTFRILDNAPPLQPATLRLAGHLFRRAQCPEASPARSHHLNTGRLLLQPSSTALCPLRSSGG